MPTRSPASVKPTAGRVAGAYVQPLLELAVERGVALPALALAAGLPETSLSPYPNRWPLPTTCACWTLAPNWPNTHTLVCTWASG